MICRRIIGCLHIAKLFNFSFQDESFIAFIMLGKLFVFHGKNNNRRVLKIGKAISLRAPWICCQNCCLNFRSFSWHWYCERQPTWVFTLSVNKKTWTALATYNHRCCPSKSTFFLLPSLVRKNQFKFSFLSTGIFVEIVLQFWFNYLRVVVFVVRNWNRFLVDFFVERVFFFETKNISVLFDEMNERCFESSFLWWTDEVGRTFLDFFLFFVVFRISDSSTSSSLLLMLWLVEWNKTKSRGVNYMLIICGFFFVDHSRFQWTSRHAPVMQTFTFWSFRCLSKRFSFKLIYMTTIKVYCESRIIKALPDFSLVIKSLINSSNCAARFCVQITSATN